MCWNPIDNRKYDDCYKTHPLFHKVLMAETEEIRKLFERDDYGRNIINQVYLRGETLLHWAAFHGRDDIARILIKHGADVTAKESNPSPLGCIFIL